MTDLVLRKIDDGYRSYELPGVGSLRFGKWLYGKAEAQAGGSRWTLDRPGLVRLRVRVRDERSGDVVVDARLRGGFPRDEFTVAGRRLRWSGPILAEGDRELARLEGPGPGREPVLVHLADGASPPPLALLLGCFLMIAAADADAAATGGAGVTG